MRRSFLRAGLVLMLALALLSPAAVATAAPQETGVGALAQRLMDFLERVLAFSGVPVEEPEPVTPTTTATDSGETAPSDDQELGPELDPIG